MILGFGKHGQLATKLRAYEDVRTMGRDEADLAQPEVCADIIKRLQPRFVINAAAFTAVDRAEAEKTAAMQLNAAAPTILAKACATLDIPFVHVSTDYVFDGSGDQPWQPSDRPNPQNVYGQSKYEGELGVAGAGGRYAIVRTSWVVSSLGSNFVKTMLRLSRERKKLNIVSDQVGGPTSARALAAALMRIGDRLCDDEKLSGIYHYAGSPYVSWASFAEDIFREAGLEVSVAPIPTSQYPTPAKRPLNSRLDCRSTYEAFGLAPAHWRDDLPLIIKACLKEQIP